MIHCATCTTRDYCTSWSECRQGVPLVERITPRPPVPLPVEVPSPAESVVKAPAPSNEPKTPMATQQTAETRAMWLGIVVAALNAALLALGLTGADVGPVVDALVVGEWMNAVGLLIGILMVFFRNKLAGLFGGPQT